MKTLFSRRIVRLVTMSSAAVSTVLTAAIVETACSSDDTAVPSASAPDGSTIAQDGAPTTTPGDGSITPTPDGSTTTTTATRPSYNTGTGFFVLNGKLYDANGVEFRPRGVNKVHYDLDSPGIPNSHANIERWVVYDFSKTTANQAFMQNIIDHKMVPMPGNWAGTCDSDAATLSGMVDTWVSQESTWSAYEKYMILNIANEYGPSASSGAGWRDEYIAAVKSLRDAGYKCTISITSGGCGQDNGDLVKYAQAVFDSDPQKNIIFDQHIYGGWSDSADAASYETDLTKGMDALKALGLVVIVGEFGPGRNIGPSPTTMTPNDVIDHAEARNLGWLAWAWDDNNLGGAQANDDSFSMTYNPAGAFQTSDASDLTIYGKAVVEDPKDGLLVLAKPATIF